MINRVIRLMEVKREGENSDGHYLFTRYGETCFPVYTIYNPVYFVFCKSYMMNIYICIGDIKEEFLNR